MYGDFFLLSNAMKRSSLAFSEEKKRTIMKCENKLDCNYLHVYDLLHVPFIYWQCIEICIIQNLFCYVSKDTLFLQVRLHDIITSSKVANCNKPVEFPWMVDGAGVPKNAAQLLTSLV